MRRPAKRGKAPRQQAYAGLATGTRLALRRLRVRLQASAYQGLDARAVFERVYASGAWGRAGPADSCSGSGSDICFTAPYVTLVRDYARAHGVRRIVDLGCGDFRVGRQLLDGGDWTYLGVDIARPLIAELNTRHGGDRIRFDCLDIVCDPLPDGDLYLLRQVLQHLDNARIGRVLERLRAPHVLVTEHVPAEPRGRANRDKPMGPDIRLYTGSGVFPELPPFNRSVESLLAVPCPFHGHAAVLRTVRLLPGPR